MEKKQPAPTQHDLSAARTETEDRIGRAMRPNQKTKPETGATIARGCDLGSDAAGAEDTLPPPHPALVEIVRLLARADARRARADEEEMRK
jgi:hypothetical protein